MNTGVSKEVRKKYFKIAVYLLIKISFLCFSSFIVNVISHYMYSLFRALNFYINLYVESAKISELCSFQVLFRLLTF